MIDGQPGCEQDHLAVHQQVSELDLRQKAMACIDLNLSYWLPMMKDICIDFFFADGGVS